MNVGNKMLTLHQPWASLVAVGRKRIETRSWSTSYRGPLAIHAAKRPPRDGECPGRVEWNQVTQDVNGAGWIYWLPEPWTEEEQVLAGLPPDGDLCAFPLPLGAVVATCTLVDVAPIGGPTSFRTGTFEGDEGDFPDRPVVVHHPPYLGVPPVHGESLVLDNGSCTDITDQLPFGDFQPGRYAWLLENIAYIDPVPARGRQGLWESRWW